MLKGNKGEWSELYVIIKMLADGKLLQANTDLSTDENLSYIVKKVYKDEKNLKLEFTLTDDKRIITKNNADEKVLINSVEDFKILADKMLFGIQNSSKVFEIKSVAEELKRLSISKLKADTKTKVDVRVKIYDYRIAREADLGFSIKSLIGSKSTLFNTGPGNNFRYLITNYFEPDLLKFNTQTKQSALGKNIIGKRIDLIEARNGSLRFQKIMSPQLSMNLRMIDGDLPSILQHALYYRFKLGKTRVDTVTEMLETEDPLNYYDGNPSEQKLYKYKIKRFLMEAAMGMTSETVWSGEYDSFGGVIVAKKDGNLVCFHIYDINLFRDYLFNNTSFDQPSTGEDEENPGNPKVKKTMAEKKHLKDHSQPKTNNYGWLLEEDGKNYIDINLQIRFTK